MFWWDSCWWGWKRGDSPKARAALQSSRNPGSGNLCTCHVNECPQRAATQIRVLIPATQRERASIILSNGFPLTNRPAPAFSKGNVPTVPPLPSSLEGSGSPGKESFPWRGRCGWDSSRSAGIAAKLQSTSPTIIHLLCVFVLL